MDTRREMLTSPKKVAAYPHLPGEWKFLPWFISPGHVFVAFSPQEMSSEAEAQKKLPTRSWVPIAFLASAWDKPNRELVARQVGSGQRQLHPPHLLHAAGVMLLGGDMQKAMTADRRVLDEARSRGALPMSSTEEEDTKNLPGPEAAKGGLYETGYLDGEDGTPLFSVDVDSRDRLSRVISEAFQLAVADEEPDAATKKFILPTGGAIPEQVRLAHDKSLPKEVRRANAACAIGLFFFVTRDFDARPPSTVDNPVTKMLLDERDPLTELRNALRPLRTVTGIGDEVMELSTRVLDGTEGEAALVVSLRRLLETAHRDNPTTITLAPDGKRLLLCGKHLVFGDRRPRSITSRCEEGRLLLALARGKSVPLASKSAVSHLRDALHKASKGKFALDGKASNLKLAPPLQLSHQLSRNLDAAE